jgi:hypothetical protein
MTMTKGELDLLHKHLDLCVRYLEFGSGESTLYAADRPAIIKIDSVESSQSFVDNHLKRQEIIIKALVQKKLVFHMIDIGEVNLWGGPMNSLKRHLWPNYSLSVFHQESKHDLALIDGRFRVSCTLNSILNTPDYCKIIIHDFWNRPQYHVLLRYLQVVERIDTLGVFAKKKGVNHAEIQKMIVEYQYLPGDELEAGLLDRLTKKILNWR